MRDFFKSVYPLLQAIKMIGSQKRMSKILNVTPPVVNSWVAREVRVPLHHALTIEMFLEGAISAEALCPHLQSEIIKYKKYFLKKTLQVRTVETSGRVTGFYKPMLEDE